MAYPLISARTAKKDSVISAGSLDAGAPSPFDRDRLREQARWIRDTLDPQVAQDGPDALHSDDILTLDEVLRSLLSSGISLEDVRYSRMHLAVNEIAGRATRWPKKLIDRCEILQAAWEQSYGPLQDLGTPLYEAGGRLHGICKPEDLSKDKLLIKWLRGGAKINPMVSRKPGSLGFTPGSWWISPIFAYRDGIIDSGNSEGHVVCDSGGAYAVVLTGGDEISGPDLDSFQYRCRDNDPGRYRLTAGTPESRHPIRILRSHSLRSFCKPRAGLRYDGLHKVTGWTIKHDNRTNQSAYIVSFRRLASEVAMEEVLKRPWSDEVEDYAEYKRIRQIEREKQKDIIRPVPKIALDGTTDFEPPEESESESASESPRGTIYVWEDSAAQTPFQEQFTDRIPDEEAVTRNERALGELSPNEVPALDERDSVNSITQRLQDTDSE